MIHSRSRPVIVAVLSSVVIVLAGGTSARAQEVTLDRGTFRLYQDGHEIGVETFSIVRSGPPSDPVLVAHGEAVVDTAGVSEELHTMLRVLGRSRQPSVYEAVVDGTVTQRVSGRSVGGRFSATIHAERGEERREYLVSDDLVVLDDGVAHLHYFLARRHIESAERVTVIVPRQGRQLMVSITDRGTRTLEVGGDPVTARVLSLETGTGDESRLWIDDDGRVLQLEIPARNLVVYRATPLP